MSCFLSSKKPVAVLEHICSGYRMLLEQERYYGLGMGARLSYALGTRTL